ncbi:MAG: O-antigen ligase family protein [Candidatus Moraniibacteriota bacterium]
MSFLEKTMLIFLFGLPFQFALHPAAGVDLALARVLAVGMFLAWGARSLLRKNIILPRPQAFFFFSSYLAWAVVSIVWAGNTDWALRKVLFLLSFMPLFIVFVAVLGETSFREKAIKAFGYGAFLSAFLALAQFFCQFVFGVGATFTFWVREVLPFFLGPNFSAAVADYPSLLVNISGSTLMRAIGVFPDPHMFSFFLGMSLPLTLALAVRSAPGKRHVWVIGAGMIFLADLLTFSRGGYIGLIFGMSAFFFPLLAQSAQRKKQLSHIGLGALFVCGVVFLSPVGARLFSSFSRSDGSNVERLRLWQESAVFIVEHPVLGAGLGNYPLAVKPSASYREPIYAHNLYLDVASELGLVGLFFFSGLLVLGILSAWQKWQGEHDIFALAFCSSLILFSVHSFFETPLFSVHVLPSLFFLIAASIV